MCVHVATKPWTRVAMTMTGAPPLPFHYQDQLQSLREPTITDVTLSIPHTTNLLGDLQLGD